MNTLQLNIEKNQLVGLLQTLTVSDKMEMYDVLKRSLLCDRMENMLNTFDVDGLSMDDIDKAVEEVRQERYDRDRQQL